MLERLERELDRLIARKTLITADQLSGVQSRLSAMISQVETVQKAYVQVVRIIESIPS